MGCGVCHEFAPAYHSLRRIGEPEVEPVSLGEAKEHLRIAADVAEDDSYVMGLIAAGRRLVESRIGSATTATRWTAKLSRTGCGGCCSSGLLLPMPPLLVDAEHPFECVLRREDGTKTTIDPAAYVLDDESWPAVLRPRTGWPATGCGLSVSVIFWAGVRRPEEVPAQIRAALKMLVGTWYENRESVATETGAAILPHAVDALLASESWDGRF